jgi:hypothetical protein
VCTFFFEGEETAFVMKPLLFTIEQVIADLNQHQTEDLEQLTGQLTEGDAWLVFFRVVLFSLNRSTWC